MCAAIARKELFSLLLRAAVFSTILFPLSHGLLPHKPSFRSIQSVRSASVYNLEQPTKGPYVELVVLIPAYNEEDRIRDTLESYSSYLLQDDGWRSKSRIVVANDGSTDRTVDVVKDCDKSSGLVIEYISLDKNRGKGRAISFGIQHVLQNQGKESLILLADADGSAPLECLHGMIGTMIRLLSMTETNESPDFHSMALVNGYRTYASAAPGRVVFRWGFRLVVRLIVGNLGVRDSQCGFKLMTGSAAGKLYNNLHLDGWAHDVEVLYRARELGILVDEQEVEWEDKDGSKLSASPGGVVGVSLRMFYEVLQVRLGYTLRGWKID